MKKTILNFGILVAISTLFTLHSCTKENDASKNTSAVSLGSSKITGRITADLNLANGNFDREGVEGITIVASIKAEDLISTGSVNGVGLIRTYEAVTDSNGFYTLNIDVNNKPVNVTLDFPKSFSASQTLENGASRITEFNKLTVIPTSMLLTRGQSYIQNAEYVYSFQPEIGTVKISGEVFFRNNRCRKISAELDSQLSIVPTNTVLVLSWTDDIGNKRKETVVTDANGKFGYSIETKNPNLTVLITGKTFYAELQNRTTYWNGTFGPCNTTSSYPFNFSQFCTINKNEVFQEPIIFE